MTVSSGIRMVLSAILVLALPLQARSAVAVVESAPLSLTIPTLNVPPQLTLDFSAGPWTQAAKVKLGYDRLTHAPAQEPTDALLWTDGKFLFVGFDATQTHSGVVMNQHSNNVGVIRTMK